MTRSPPPQRVPTLTDIVALPESGVADLAVPEQPPMSGPPAADASACDAELRAEIERLIEAHLPAALDAAWKQVLPSLLEATRRELAPSLRESIDRAVAEHFSGHRNGG